MSDKTLTSCNTVITLTATNPYLNNTIAGTTGISQSALDVVSPYMGVPFKLEGLYSEGSFTTNQNALAETEMDMEGNLYGGHVVSGSVIEFSMTFLPTSPSLDFLDYCYKVINLQREVLVFSGDIDIPSQRKKFTLIKGYWINCKLIPDHGRILANVPCAFRFQAGLSQNY